MNGEEQILYNIYKKYVFEDLIKFTLIRAEFIGYDDKLINPRFVAVRIVHEDDPISKMIFKDKYLYFQFETDNDEFFEVPETDMMFDVVQKKEIKTKIMLVEKEIYNR
jgi:hypothetical protein